MSPENKSVSLHDAVKLLLEADDIYLLCHQYPDGDTLGLSLIHIYNRLVKPGKDGLRRTRAEQRAADRRCQLDGAPRRQRVFCARAPY